MEPSTPSCSWTFWKISAFHTKEELMETTFGCKTTTFAHINIMAAAVKEFLEEYGPVLVPCPTCFLDMDPTEHALDDFGCAIINRDNLPLTLHEVAQAPTKDSDALDIETIGNLEDRVL